MRRLRCPITAERQLLFNQMCVKRDVWGEKVSAVLRSSSLLQHWGRPKLNCQYKLTVGSIGELPLWTLQADGGPVSITVPQRLDPADPAGLPSAPFTPAGPCGVPSADTALPLLDAPPRVCSAAGTSSSLAVGECVDSFIKSLLK